MKRVIVIATVAAGWGWLVEAAAATGEEPRGRGGCGGKGGEIKCGSGGRGS